MLDAVGYVTCCSQETRSSLFLDRSLSVHDQAASTQTNRPGNAFNYKHNGSTHAHTAIAAGDHSNGDALAGGQGENRVHSIRQEVAIEKRTVHNWRSVLVLLAPLPPLLNAALVSSSGGWGFCRRVAESRETARAPETSQQSLA